MDGADLTEDGWAVTTHDLFRFVTEHPAPRPYGYADQIWVDLRSWKPAVLWVVAITLVIAGLMAEQWLALPLGFGLIAFYLWAIRGTVKYLRDTPAVVGRIDRLSRHPLLPDHSTAMAVLTDGRTVPVAVRTRLVSWILKQGLPAEVLVLLDDRSKYCTVIGARALGGAEV
jgi:hypothetical protein